MAERILTRAEAMDYLGVKATKFDELRRAGKVRPVPYHRGLYDKAVLDNYLDNVSGVKVNKPDPRQRLRENLHGLH